MTQYMMVVNMMAHWVLLLPLLLSRVSLLRCVWGGGALWEWECVCTCVDMGVHGCVHVWICVCMGVYM